MDEEIFVPFKAAGSSSELSLIANSISNTDELVRRIQLLTEENQKLKLKYKSLNQSAKQVKELYEQERTTGLELNTKYKQLSALISDLRERNRRLEHVQVNMKLTHEQAIAEVEAKVKLEHDKCNHVFKELVLQCQELDTDFKFKLILKQAVDVLINRGVEINKDRFYSKNRRRKRKKHNGSSINGSICSGSDSFDPEESSFDAFPDNVSVISVIDEIKPKPMDIESELSTEQKKTFNSIAINTEPCIEKTLISVETNTEIKIFTDKSTSYTNSTTTRGTSTFVETVNVSTNFPEVHLLPNITDILNEMIFDMPPLLEPIDDLPPKTQSSQTDKVLQQVTSPQPKRKTRSYGVNTILENIRRPLDYNNDTTFDRIKKEDPFGVLSTIQSDNLNPQLTCLWALLGQMIFRVIGNGQVFEPTLSSNVEQTWEQIRELQEMIEMQAIHEDRRTSILSQFFLPPMLNRIEKCHNTQRNKGHPTCDDPMPADVENAHDSMQHEGLIAPTLSPTLQNTVAEQAGTSVEGSINVPGLNIENIADNSNASIDTQCVSSVIEKEPPVSPVDQSLVSELVSEQIERSPPRIKQNCQKILQSMRLDLAIISPIKRTPTRNKHLITLNDLLDNVVDTSQDESETEELIKSILSEESPESPPPSQICEVSDADRIIPLDVLEECEGISEVTNMECDFYDSPQSPSAAFNEQECTTVSIPLDNKGFQYMNQESFVSCNSVVNNIINSYDHNQRKKVVEYIHTTAESPKQSRKIEMLRKNLNKYLEDEWTSLNLKMVCMKCMKYALKQDIILSAIIETIEDSADEPIDMTNTPPAPPLPLTHQKLILLIQKLNSQIPDFHDSTIQTLERKMFTLKSADQGYGLEILLSLTHFYIGLIDIEGPGDRKSKALMFIYKALYYFTHKSFPLIYAMLSAQPNCIPKSTDVAYKNDNPLITTIKGILMNSSRENLEKTEYKKKDLRTMLIKRYGFLPFIPKIDDVIKELVEKLKTNCLDKLDYSFILLSKRYGYEWAVTTLIKPHLYPLLDQFMAASMDTDLHDQKIVLCIKTISGILKTYSLTADISYCLQMFTMILERSNKKIIQEAAIKGLIRFQRFGFLDVYQRLSNWNPEYQISDKLLAMLRTFVHRKDIRFWSTVNRQIR